jgi:hypothetical protein
MLINGSLGGFDKYNSKFLENVQFSSYSSGIFRIVRNLKSSGRLKTKKKGIAFLQKKFCIKPYVYSELVTIFGRLRTRS